LRLRLVHLKNSLNFFEYSTLKRVVDLAIFLSVFALMASIISISYEIKINDISLAISKEQTKQRIYNQWTQLISENLHKSDRRFTQTNDIINITYESFDDDIALEETITFRIFQILNQMPTQLKNSAHDMRYNFTEDQLLKYNVFSLEEGYDNAVNILKNTNYNNPKANFRLLQKNLINSIFETRGLLEDALDIFQSAKKDIDNKIIELNSKKNEVSKLSTNIILFSFILQLLIFIVVQFVDIRSSEEV
jgi:hypothetical protein